MPIFIGVKHVIHILALLFTNLILAQNAPKVSEIYDFDIGDEFHYLSSNYGRSSSSEHRTSYKITDKWYSNNLDTVYYKRLVKESIYSSSIFSMIPSFRLNTFTDIIEFGDLNGLIDAIDSTRVVSNCGDTIYGNYSDWKKPLGPYDFSYSAYAKGLGMVDYRYFDQQSVYTSSGESEKLLFYRKGNRTCGDPYIFPGSEDQQLVERINIYPNPVSDVIYLSCKETYLGEFEIEIYSAMGILLKTKNRYIIPTAKIQLTDLVGGIYFLQITSENGSTARYSFVKK